MTEFIEFCNKNQGFVSALLSLFTIFISAIAIAVSIHTSKLPYKKKLSLQLRASYSVPAINLIGFSVDVTNIGNLPVYLDFFGIAFRKNGQTKKIYSDLQQAQQGRINVGDTLQVIYSPEIMQKLKGMRYFLLAIEPNGKRYVCNKRQLRKAAK